ncbi:MAG: hypothetical protein IJ497_03595 [Clostridia bacterium]|nr:hypothetical protein [Clostridia bacterium]
MKLLKYELTKHLTPFTVIFTSVMLVLSLGVVFLQYAGDGSADAVMIRDAQDDVLSDYVNDRETYDADYAEYEKRYAAFEEAVSIRRMSDEWYTIRLQSEKIDLDTYDDQKLYRDVKEIIARTEGYGDTLRKVIRQAYAKIEEIGILPGNYVYDYQAALITHYAPLTELEIPVEAVRGWEEFFTLETPVIFLAVTILGVLVSIFITEKRNRTLSVLRICKNGGWQLVLAKLLCTAVFSAVLTLAFTLTPLIVLHFTTGLSDPAVPVQALPSFPLCPYPITIAQYLALFVLIRLAVFFVLSLAAAVLGQLIGSEVGVLAGMSVFLVLSYLLSRVDYYSPFFPLRQFNFFDSAFVTLFFDRYRAVNLAGQHVGLILTAGVLLFVIAAVLVVLSFLVKLRSSQSFRRSIRQKASAKPVRRQKMAESMSLSVLRYEFDKYILHPRAAIILVLALAVKIVLSSMTFTPDGSVYEEIYRGYITELAGEVSPEKDAYISEEEAYIRASTADYEDAYDRYKAGGITYDEYRVITEKKNYAELVERPFEQLRQRQSYLKSVDDGTFDGISYVYEAGVMRLLRSGMDIPLILLAMLLYADLFAREYRSGFIMIQSLTRYGGRRTLAAKYILAVSVMTVLYLLFTAADVFFLIRYYGTDCMTAGIMSIPDLASLRWNLSVWEYILLYKLVSWFGFVLLATGIASVSLLTKNILTAAVVTLGAVFIPAFLAVFGIDVLAPVNLTAVLNPTIVTDSILQLILYTAVGALLAFLGSRKWKLD